MPEDPALALRTASSGLMYPSESEFPLEVLAWKDGARDMDEATLLRLAGRPADAQVARADLDGFFEIAAAEQAWHNDTERSAARRYQSLLRILKSALSDIQVFRVGAVEIDVYIVGRTPGGDWAGLQTKVIET
jgi:hypothetical protein